MALSVICTNSKGHVIHRLQVCIVSVRGLGCDRRMEAECRLESEDSADTGTQRQGGTRGAVLRGTGTWSQLDITTVTALQNHGHS